MQTGIRAALVCVLLTNGACFAAGATNTGAGPSLDATMKFIQKELVDEGKFDYITFTSDTRSSDTIQHEFVDQMSAVMADPQACGLRYHRFTSVDGGGVFDQDAAMDFRGVKNVQVMPNEAVDTETNARGGNPNLIVTSTSPPIHVVMVRNSGNKGGYLLFHYREDADRVAKAIVHAVELCGGGSNDPF